MKSEKDSRKTISIAKVVMDWAEEIMRDQGFNKNFSAYVAHLIRQDKERIEDKQLSLGKSSNSTSVLPLHHEARPAPKKKTGT